MSLAFETTGQWARRRIDEAWEFLVGPLFVFIVTNFNIILLFGWVVFMLFYVLHISHDGADKELIGWSREVTAGVIGALLGMLTGAKMGLELARKTVLEAKAKDADTP